MRKITFLLLSFFLITAISFAQQKKYISYEIKKGETLKKVAKRHNMSTKDLSRLNPDISRKPALGTVIIIPNKNYGKATTIAEQKPRTGYIVKAKETIFGISKRFGITTNELNAANPALKDGLKIGMELTIPKPTIAQPKDSTNYILHTVIKDDTVFNLTKRYNVSESELLVLNPHLKDGLNLGMLLKIKPIDASILEDEINALDSIPTFNENLDLEKKINVAIILPYQLNKLNDSLIDQSFNKKSSLLNIATDFHLGTEIAIDSLRKKGLKINVTYLDSENSNPKLQRLINSNQNFKSTDVIIGPLFFDKAHWVSTRTNTPVVAPLFSKKQDKLNSRSLVKSKPNTEAHQQKLLKHLETSYNGENVLVINDGRAETQSQLWQIVNKIKSFDSIQTISVIKPEEGYIAQDKFYQKLDSLSSNWVILVSDEMVTTSTTVNNLKGFAERIDIDLFALNKDKNFNNIDNSFLGKLNFVYPTSEFIKSEDTLVNSFYNLYYKRNKVYPSKYAIRGFDVTYDTLARIATDQNLDDGLIDGKSTRVSSIFEYTQNSFGSYENNGLYLIQYTEDLNVILLE